MFKRTLVVLEPPAQASGVIPTSAALARGNPPELVFYTGLATTKSRATHFTLHEAAPDTAAAEDLRQQAEHLHAQAAGIAEGLGLLSRSVITTPVDPVPELLAAAKAHRCDAVVVANEGGHAVSRLLHGSLVPGLVTASPLPVMVCPPPGTPTHGAWHAGAAGEVGEASAVGAAGKSVANGPRRILIMLEVGELGRVELAQALDLAREHSAQLVFIHIVPPDLPPMVDLSGFAPAATDLLSTELRLSSQRLVASAQAAATKAGLSSRGLSLPAGTTPKDIAHMAIDMSCDLILVAHSGSNAITRLLTGSLIPGLITVASVPVLICRVRPPAPRRRAPRKRPHRNRAAAAAEAAQAAAASRATQHHGP